jgi:hypothetical protein
MASKVYIHEDRPLASAILPDLTGIFGAAIIGS